MIYTACRRFRGGLAIGREAWCLVLLAALIAGSLAPRLAGALTIQEVRLENGLRILYGESPASGLVASAESMALAVAVSTDGRFRRNWVP